MKKKTNPGRKKNLKKRLLISKSVLVLLPRSEDETGRALKEMKVKKNLKKHLLVLKSVLILPPRSENESGAWFERGFLK